MCMIGANNFILAPIVCMFGMGRGIRLGFFSLGHWTSAIALGGKLRTPYDAPHNHPTSQRANIVHKNGI